MSHGPDLIYVYDGSFMGLMCCVFESYAAKELPLKILPPEGQIGLFSFVKNIETDDEKGERVYRAIRDKISPRAQELVRLGFLTCLADKEMLILNFLRLGFKVGNKVTSMLTHEAVCELEKGVRALKSESHKYLGFVRFSDYGGVLVGVIEPKNFVLPLMVHHFSDRYRNESFLIYDKSHKAALVYHDHKAEIIEIDELVLPQPDEKEVDYRRLWKQFYKTIAIEGRYNPRCRMTHMPKRFWQEMTEFYDEERITGKNSKENKLQEKFNAKSVIPLNP